MYVVSFDTATKSLAISIIYYDKNAYKKIQILYDNWLLIKSKLIKEIKSQNKLSIEYKDDIIDVLINKLVDSYNELLASTINIIDNMMQIKYLNVIDLIPDKKISETDVVFRTRALRTYMCDKFDIILHDIMEKNSQPLLFLLEYQMGPNVKSNAISTQIIYHLAKYEAEIQLVGPTLKNKIFIGGSQNHYSNFIEKYKTNYAANKNHTKTSFLSLIESMKGDVAKECKKAMENIAKKNIDDIADSVMMSISYVIKTYWNS